MPLIDRLKSVYSHLSGSFDSGAVYRLVVEITNRCNLTCRMCPRSFMTRKLGHMNPDLFASLIRDNRHWLEFVSLNGYGEPLLCPNLDHYLRTCRKWGVASGISTNCTLLNAKKAQMLLETPPDLMILALDAIDAQTYESVRVGARFDDVIQNVAGFLELSKKAQKKPFIVIQSICMTETIDQIDQFKNYFKRYPFVSIRIRQLTFSGLERNDRDYSNSRKACYWLWNEPMVLWDGTLVACCQDVNGQLAIGNVNKDRLNDLWHQARIQYLRKAHANGKRDGIAICKRCNMVQPNPILATGAAFFSTMKTNQVLPDVETVISRLRYRR